MHFGLVLILESKVFAFASSWTVETFDNANRMQNFLKVLPLMITGISLKRRMLGESGMPRVTLRKILAESRSAHMISAINAAAVVPLVH